MRIINLARGGVAALFVVVVLVSGAVLGSTLATRDHNPSPSPVPSPSAPAATPVESALPAADVAGEDLKRLPRYPGSVRSAFDVSLADGYRLTATEFLTDAALDDVRSFYQQVMVEYGWQRADIGYAAGEWTYVLVDGRTEALVKIEAVGGLVEIDLQISAPIETPPAEPTPVPVTPPPPAPPAPPPPDDDDDDDGGGDDDTDDDWTDD